MKNPFKGIGDKVKSLRDKWQQGRKRESAKVAIDGLGDSSIVGGLALIGTAAFMPAAPVTVLIAGGVFIAAGGAAKLVAAKMKPDSYDVTNPQDAQTAPPAEQKPAMVTRIPANDFNNTVENKQAKTGTPAAKTARAPKP